jgi:hypothetical protein
MSIHDEAQAQSALEARARRAGREPFAQRMAESADANLFAELRRDARCNPVTASSSMIPGAPEGGRPAIGNGGWIDPPTVRDWKPPGLATMDRLMNQQDALDRAERVRRFNRLPLSGGK